MKYIIALFTLFFMATWVNALNVQYQDMSDFEIARYAVEHPQDTDCQGDIIYPTVNETWYVGQQVNVTFKPIPQDQTVSIFFFDKSQVLAGGSLNTNESTIFTFTVPSEAISGPESTSLLLAVRRQNRYLQGVDSVTLHII